MPGQYAPKLVSCIVRPYVNIKHRHNTLKQLFAENIRWKLENWQTEITKTYPLSIICVHLNLDRKIVIFFLKKL